ncbi:MAG: hypothetical protein CEE38_09050 [Planctomycetes bacterium B3_Pla]|nr:MAG: hypothetical protein CEE38_09050 [Planctomycetes bacterium B3_Pla]
MPTERIEDLIRNAKVTTSATTDERIIAAVEAATTKPNEQHPASVRTGGAIRRIIMKSNWTKLATAATVIVAIGLGMYALTGSGTSITMAQVRQAMKEIDWVQMNCRSEDMKLTAWYSFTSKVQIGVVDKGKIIYYDFNAGKMLIWNPGSDDIYESDIEEGKQFAGGMSNIYERLTESLNSWGAEGKYKVTREHGTYQDRKIEIWTARRIKGEPKLTRTETMTMYIDVEKKLPLTATDVKGAYGDIQQTNHVEFKYPETGPADIYEAGAPRSAQIKPASDQ